MCPCTAHAAQVGYGLFPLLCTVGFTVYVFAKSFIARWR